MKIQESNLDWDEYFIQMAELTAKKSKDPSTKCGVVLVGNNNEVLGIGFNGFPRGVKDYAERYNDRPMKYKHVCHSEVNAICNCARHGIKTEGATMYTNFGPLTCQDCAKAVIQAGISKIVGRKQEEFSDGSWKDSIDTAIQMFKEAGIEIKEI